MFGINRGFKMRNHLSVISTVVVEGKANMKVYKLIDHNTWTWNHHIIHHLFNAQDREERIPLNLLHTEDEWIIGTVADMLVIHLIP
jgi:hypothetical protein